MCVCVDKYTTKIYGKSPSADLAISMLCEKVSESDTISQYQSFVKGLNKGKREGKECIEISQSPQSHKQPLHIMLFWGSLHA